MYIVDTWNYKCACDAWVCSKCIIYDIAVRDYAELIKTYTSLRFLFPRINLFYIKLMVLFGIDHCRMLLNESSLNTPEKPSEQSQKPFPLFVELNIHFSCFLYVQSAFFTEQQFSNLTNIISIIVPLIFFSHSHFSTSSDVASLKANKLVSF